MSPKQTEAGDDLFVGDSEMAALMRRQDWGATPLGPAADWPQSLRSIARMMLTSRYQMWMGWGPRLTFLYNDAYRPTLGVKHPSSLARPASEVWREVWSDLAPLVDHVLRTGEATYNEGMLLLLERSGFPEETYHTFSYSPLFDEHARIAGLFCVVVEESERIINDRRLATLRDLASAASTAITESELFSAVCEQLAGNPRDLPLTLCYLFEEDRRFARLVCASGVEEGHPAAPRRLSIEDGPWPEAPTGSTDPPAVADLTRRFTALPAGAWDRPPRQALLAPLAQQGQDRSAAGFIVAGANPYRPLDASYRGFVDLLAGQIGAALASVRAYEAERLRAEALAEIDRAKTAFFSNVSHEFRTPLTLMLGPLEEIMASPHPADEAARVQVELAHRNGLRLLRLVNTLLDVSRIEAGRVQASFQPTDLAAFCGEIASSFRAAVEKAGLRLDVSCEPIGEPVFVDPDLWEKILLNLLSNAFKFTLEGEIVVATRRSGDGRHAEVRVGDTGVGVPAEELPRLFDRFHRVEGTQGRSFEGSGIGLALVHELVGLHGGTISVDSAVGVGTTFTVSLPLGVSHLPPAQVRGTPAAIGPIDARAYLEDAGAAAVGEPRPPRPAAAGLSADDLPIQGSATPGPATEGHGRTILLADDNADMRDYVRRLLEARGYGVLAVGDGEAALAQARAAAPDLILTDVMMPKMDGFQLLAAIRDDPALATIPVIMLSARAGEEAKIEGMERGADDYLVKPFAARELLARVNANIHLAETRREAAVAVMRSERRAILTQERLSLALSTGRVAVFESSVDPERVIIHGPLARAFGVSPEAAAEGLPLAAYLRGLHPDDVRPVLDAVQVAVDAGEAYEVEFRAQGDGQTRTILARGQIEDSPGGRRIIGALIDATDEKAAEQALKALNASLEARVQSELAARAKAEDALRQAQKMEAVGQLTGGVAHDFNNLLTVIIGGLDTIRRAPPEDHARIRRAAEMARRGADRAASLTGRLLAFARRQALDPRPVEINALVREMTELLHRTLGEAVELEGVLTPRLWLAEIDQNQLESAILNLAVNARDAMSEGGRLTLETANVMLDESYAATASEVSPGQYVMVAVSDTGVGMSKEGVARAFEPFYTTKEVGRGTGLGLSMVYGFVKQSGGHVAIYSEVGQGTTVRLYFPRYRGEGAHAQPAARAAVPGASREEVVLVVEDNDDVRGYSVTVLKELGYGVLEANGADQALPILAGGARIDLLFTDVVLPGRSGRAIADAALELRPDLRILYTTGYSRNAIVHGGRLDPGVKLLTKPFTFEALALAVRDCLDG